MVQFSGHAGQRNRQELAGADLARDEHQPDCRSPAHGARMAVDFPGDRLRLGPRVLGLHVRFVAKASFVCAPFLAPVFPISLLLLAPLAPVAAFAASRAPFFRFLFEYLEVTGANCTKLGFALSQRRPTLAE